MQELIAEIRAAANGGIYFLALFGTLTLPDICGALDSDNGRASGPKYRDWLSANAPQYAASAGDIYGLRCSLLHQGSSTPHGGLFPVAFTLPGSAQVHNLTMDVNGRQVGWLSLPIFVDEVTAAAEDWFARVGGTTKVQRNMASYARLRSDGYPPFIAGFPVIG